MDVMIIASVSIIVAVIFSLLTALFLRRRWLSAAGGVFDCGMRKLSAGAGNWVMGIARYHGETLEWYRVFSLSFKPRVIFTRNCTVVTGSRPLDVIEAMSLFDDHLCVECRLGEAEFELSMTPESMTGFLSWLEAAPPRSGIIYSED